jgi:hypothetical protein
MKIPSKGCFLGFEKQLIVEFYQVAVLNCSACREHVLKHFSVQPLTDGYEAIYQQILAQRFAQNGHVRNLMRV